MNPKIVFIVYKLQYKLLVDFLLPHPKRLCNWLCIFVCLFSFFQEVYGNVNNGSRNRCLDFGDDRDHSLDPRFLKDFFFVALFPFHNTGSTFHGKKFYSVAEQPQVSPFHASCTHYRQMATDWTRFFSRQ